MLFSCIYFISAWTSYFDWAHTTQHTQIWACWWCVWILPHTSFCAGNLSHEPVSSEAQEHLELQTEMLDNTLKASCLSLIAPSSIPTISNLPPYLFLFIAETWRPLDSREICPKLSLTWELLASSVHLQLPPEVGSVRMKNISVSSEFRFFFFLWWFIHSYKAPRHPQNIQFYIIILSPDLLPYQLCNNYSWIPDVCVCVWMLASKEEDHQWKCVLKLYCRSYASGWKRRLLIIERVLNDRSAALARQLLITRKVSYFQFFFFIFASPRRRLLHLLPTDRKSVV